MMHHPTDPGFPDRPCPCIRRQPPPEAASAGSSWRRWSIGLGLVVLAQLSAGESPPPPLLNRSIQALKRIDAVWQQQLSGIVAESARHLQLVIPRSAGVPSLQIDLITEPTLLARGQAWAWERQLLIDGVDGSGLKIQGKSISGRLKVAFPADPLADAGGSPLVVDLDLQIQINDKTLDGSCTVRARGVSRSPNITGFFAPLGEICGPQVPDKSLADVPSQYRLLLVIEQEGLRLLRCLRALQTIGKDLKAFPPALARELLPLPRRPVLDLPPKPAAKGGNSKGPDLEGWIDEPDTGPKSPSSSMSRSDTERLRQSVADAVSSHLESLAEALTGPAVTTEPLPANEPLFGPWYDCPPLPGSEETPNQVPASAGAAGAQVWAALTHWRLLGPLPAPEPGRQLLPEILLTDQADYASINPRKTVAWKPSQLVSGGVAAGPGETSAVQIDEPLPSPNLDDHAPTAPPQPPAASHSHLWYASTSIHCSSPTSLWLGLGGGRLAVWLDGRRLPCDQSDPEAAVVLKVPFHAGRNNLMVRCAPLTPNLRLWGRLALQGAPDPAANQERLARMLAPPPPSTPVTGFRGDGSACWPEARPVTAWDLVRGVNVHWRRDLPQRGRSSPLIVADQVVVAWEPHCLAAYALSNGAPRWQVQFDVLELVGGNAASKGGQLCAAWIKAQETCQSELDRLGSNHDERLNTLACQGLDLERTEITLQELRTPADGRFQEYRAFLQAQGCPEPLDKPADDGRGWIGYAAATPVSDGESIWVRFGTGVVGCLTAEGKRRWMVPLPPATAPAWCMASSPILVANRLIVAHHSKGQPQLHLLAFDAATGTAAWSAPVLDPTGTSTPVVMRLSDGKGAWLPVVVTNGGTVVRASDGKVLQRGLPGRDPGPTSPTVAGNLLVRSGGQACPAEAIRLILLDPDTVGSRWAWALARTPVAGEAIMDSTHRPRHSDKDACASGLAWSNGVLHGIFGNPVVEGWRRITDTGTELPPGAAGLVETGIYFGGSGITDPCVPIAIAGDAVFMGVRGRRLPVGQGKAALLGRPGRRGNEVGTVSTPWTWISVAKSGPYGRIIAHNRLPGPLLAHPVFARNQTVLRTDYELICLGPTGDEGHAYESEVNARILSTWLDPVPPPSRSATTVKPMPPPNPASMKGILEQDLLSDPIDLSASVVIGPLPGEANAVASAERDLANARNQVLPIGRAVTAGGVTMQAFVLSQERKDLFRSIVDGRVFYNHGMICGGTDTVVFYHTLLRNAQERTVRFRQGRIGCRVWLAGEMIEDNDRLRLGVGVFPMLVEVRITSLPPEARLHLSLRFTDSPSNEHDAALWQAAIKTHQTCLERYLRYHQQGPLAGTMRRMLKELK